MDVFTLYIMITHCLYNIYIIYVYIYIYNFFKHCKNELVTLISMLNIDMLVRYKLL